MKYFLCLAFLANALLPVNTFSQSVSTQSSVIAPNQKIVVSFSGFPGNQQDWITIVEASQPVSTAGGYKFLNGMKSGTIEFGGMQYGDYEVRGYFNNEYILRARYRFRIGNTSQEVRLSATKEVYTPGEKIVVNFSGFPGNPKDWITVMDASRPDNEAGNYKFLDGLQNGSLTFEGLPSGSYEARGYFNNEYNIKARYKFSVGNTNQNTMVRTQKQTYSPNETIVVEFSGFPGNPKDWITVMDVSRPDNEPGGYKFLSGKQDGTIDFSGLAPGTYEVRGYFNNEYNVRARSRFTISSSSVNAPRGAKKLCRNELSLFYAGMYGLGLSWGTLGSGVYVPKMVSDVQATMGSVADALRMVSCLDFDVNRVSNFSSRLPGLSQQQAVNEIDQLIKEIHSSIQRARVGCDRGSSLESLFITGVHLGASQGIGNTFICRPIPAAWQQNMRNHLATAKSGLAGYQSCIPGFTLSVFDNVPVSALNAYEPFSFIVGIHIGVLWNVSLSDCCCDCR